MILFSSFRFSVFLGSFRLNLSSLFRLFLSQHKIVTNVDADHEDVAEYEACTDDRTRKREFDNRAQARSKDDSRQHEQGDIVVVNRARSVLQWMRLANVQDVAQAG